MRKSGLTARRLRVVLMLAMFLIAITAIVGFIIVQKQLGEYATAITRLNGNAASGDLSIQTLQQLKTKLQEEQSTIRTARSLVADGTTYNDKVLSDLTRIAKTSGVTITSFNFDSAGTGSTPQAAGTPPVPTVAAPAGVSQKSISISVQSPLPYSSLMSFLQLIETNPLKMQLNSVSITKGTGDNVTTGPFTIKVYTR